MIAVTGGAGFIGSHLVQTLVDAGAKVRVLEKPGVDVGHLPSAGVDVSFVDIRDRDSVRQMLGGCKEVFHLAANPNLWTRKRDDFILRGVTAWDRQSFSVKVDRT